MTKSELGAIMRDIIDVYPSQSAFARAAGVTHAAVHRWMKNGIGANRAISLEETTGLPRYLTRPDLWPAPRDEQ
jgi:hypothetical protein